MAKMVSFFFYKNILLGVTLFLYDSHTFFSGQQLYNDSHLSGYNIMFVAFPILVVGVWDQDVSPRMAAVYPHLYQQVTPPRSTFNTRNCQLTASAHPRGARGVKKEAAEAEAGLGRWAAARLGSPVWDVSAAMMMQ
jgi:hypothetical protein